MRSETRDRRRVSRSLGRPSPARFRVLGPLEVSRDEGTLPLGGPKQRTALAHLILNANQVVAAERLIDALWGEDPPDAARGTLQAYISRLRSVLGTDAIQGRAPGYLLRTEPDEVDALRFEQLLHDARRSDGEPRTTAATLAEALDLWRGPALADLANEASLVPEIARLEELRLQATEEEIAIELDLGRQTEAVAQLEALTREHPLRERLWGELMLALYRVDRPADALAAFERARAILADELGIDPTRELQELHARILRQDPTLDLKGEPLRGYRLLDQIGEGAFGVVYRATQPQIGREVAIKAIHPELANHPDFVRRFDREAQIVARLEHPHVVPLYDYWREPDAAYLVMRYLRGGSLEDLLTLGPLEPVRAASILDQMAAALSAAHRQGIVHRDVKPGNVLLDEEGNAYLTDFGVALDVGAPEKTSGTMMRGTPAYLSPEQIRLEPAVPASDVYALGVVLYEMLTGEHPFPASSLTALLDRHLRDPLPSLRQARPDVPVGVDDIIAKATAKVVDDRFADPVELALAFRAVLEGTAALEPVREIRNPYKGLRAFIEADAGDFFGREAVTNRLVGRLEQDDEASRFLAIVGPSGSGKSSVVRAGLIPALRRGAIEGSERWFVIDILPGTHPFRELETALLGVAVEPPPSLLEDLQRDALGLVRAAERVLPDPDAELLIILDQLEEVFTLTDEDERTRLLEAVWAAALEPASRVRIVATLRADFFDGPLSVRGFGDLLAARTEAITPMSPEELERAIVAPADRAGLAVEPRLLAAMVADVVDRPGSLPLLQYALTELAERRTDGVLTLEGYRRIGGVAGALARRAEQLYGAMNDEAKEACRQLFIRLVTLGEGSEDTRRRVPRSELTLLADPRCMDDVIDAFGPHRLLSFDRDPATREPTVEIAHEAMLVAWTRLRGWIGEARDDIRTQRQLMSAASEWANSGRDESFLLRGGRLDQVASWAATTNVALSSNEDGYVRASVAEREKERAAEAARRSREVALEHRSLKRLRALVAVFAVAALVAGSLTVVARNQSGRAGRESRIATARELAAAAVANLDVDAERAVLLAIKAVQTTRSADASVLPEAEEALHWAVVASRIVLTVPGIGGALDWSPRGVFVTEGTEDTGVIDVRDATTGQSVLSFPADDIDVNDVAFSPDGSMLATTGDDGTLKVWDPATGDNLWTLAGKGEVWAPSFSADGSLVAATWLDEGSVRVLDTSHGRVIRTLALAASDTAFSPDGRMLAVTQSPYWGDVPVFDLGTGRISFMLKGDFAGTVAWSPDGLRIATGSGDGPVGLWDGRTGEPLFTLFGHRAPVKSVDWSPDSSRLVTGSDDGTAKVWEVLERGGREELSLSALDTTAGVIAAVFSPDGEQVMTSDGNIAATKVWDVGIGGDAEWMNLPAQPNSHGDVEFLPDGRRLAATSEEGGIAIWDLTTERKLRTIRVGESGINSFDVTADGTAIAAGRTNGLATAWDLITGEELFSVEHEDAKNASAAATGVVDVEWSPDGTHLLTATPGSIRILNARGVLIRRLSEEGHVTLRSARFSPDGRLVVTAVTPVRGGSQAYRQTIWDWERGDVVGAIEPGDGNNAAYLAIFDPTGSRIVTNGSDGVPRIWDIETGRSVVALPAHPGPPWDIVFSPDGSRIATAGSDGTVRLFDAASGEQVLSLRGHEGVVARVAFSPDGTRLASESIDGTVRVWALDLDDLLEIAQQQVTRTLTDAECRQYLHLEVCPADEARPPN